MLRDAPKISHTNAEQRGSTVPCCPDLYVFHMDGLLRITDQVLWEMLVVCDRLPLDDDQSPTGIWRYSNDLDMYFSI